MNPITKATNNKFVKILKIVILLFLTTIVIFIASVELFPDNSYKGDQKDLSFIDKAAAQLRRIGVFDLVFGETSFRTSKEHQGDLGIETARLSKNDEDQLRSIINESNEVLLDYSLKMNDDDFKKVEDLYVPETFKNYKEYVKSRPGFMKGSGDEGQIPDNVNKIAYSKPRTYKDLQDRMGVINNISFIDSNGEQYNDLTQIFIFKKINNEWKIEKRREVIASTEVDEDILIQEIKDEK